ncbi:hypothetical protein ACP70R_019193 [Stipagrostis hirtigluma subsp. patula]
MAGPSAPPSPSSNSTAPPFKTNTTGPSRAHAPAQGVPASAAAAAPPPPQPIRIRVLSDATLAVLSVVAQLRTRGRLVGLEIPEAQLPAERAPALFEGVLSAFLAESEGPEAAQNLPIPPPPLADGRSVELLRLYIAVRDRGGFSAVAAVKSWPAVAEEVGLHPTAAAAVELLYAEYLAPLEQSIRRRGVGHGVVESSGDAGRRVSSKKDKFLSPTKNPASAGPAHLKRKREELVEMLNWVRGVARSPAEPGVVGMNSQSGLSAAVLLRRQMFANKRCCKGSASAQGGLSNEETARIRPCGQADIPEWTGKPSSPYDDPHALKFLGKPILFPENNEDLDGGSIGKGRQDDCNCQFPGSIACVRFHVTEKRIILKRELGSAFYEMGFDRIGEDLAQTWRKDEERKFNSTILENLPSSKYNFWGKLLDVLHSKGREGLVRYYHNVFQVWRRGYQNRLANAPDSDDDTIEPGFLHIRQPSGQSSSRSAASSGKRRKS